MAEVDVLRGGAAVHQAVRSSQRSVEWVSETESNSENLLLNQTSPVQILQHVVTTQASGKLTLYDPLDPAVGWQVFLGNGQVHYATALLGQQECLQYCLQQCGFGLPTDAADNSASYPFLCRQWQAGRLTLAELRAILTQITQDALIQILKLPRVIFQMECNVGLDPLLMSISLVKLLLPVQIAVRQWQAVYPNILSPLQRPRIKSRVKWHQTLHTPGQAIPRIHFIEPFLGRDFCLYQIAQDMGVSLPEILPLFQALLRRDLIEMRPYGVTPGPVRPTVVCIDADLAVQASVKAALEPSGYRILALTEPTHVWSALMESEPAMLLLDVDYFDGYSFVKALLRSERFKCLPVVALTERQRRINRWWAKRSGITDCLMKPFEPQALSQLVQQIMMTVIA